ncbi:hypothetical protein [Mycolicibacterium novocastrense]|uniref:hypothetical protein n=1 Tax=Mycolicibacterium novocastrense TaxID=59813 RepID=UPI000A7C08B6|nr:hypothetical protein [Mycolicibacterium novocastrense]
MGELRRRVGFLAAVGRLRLSQFATIELGGALVVGIAASIFLVTHTDVTARVGFAGDILSLTAALVGVVFAALALVVALLSESYLRLLNAEDAEQGLLAFLSPFMLVIGIQVTTVVGAVGYRAFANFLPKGLEPWLFGVLVTLFLMSALEIVALARSVVMHGLARAKLREITDLSEERDRRSGSR